MSYTIDQSLKYAYVWPMSNAPVNPSISGLISLLPSSKSTHLMRFHDLPHIHADPRNMSSNCASPIVSFPPEVIESLKSYVYCYIDPRDGRPFYIGKGIGNRAFAHLCEKGESNKIRRIESIRASGQEPKIEILRHGLTDDQAALVEAAVIDCIGLENLTNEVSGLHSHSFGRVSVEDVLLAQTAPQADIREPCILITINRLYRSGMTPVELYEATRGVWKIGPRREMAEFAMAVYQGVIREVYRIQRWHPAGTLSYKTRDINEAAKAGRWEFEGAVAIEDRKMYVRTSVRHLLGASNQNPIRYVNC